MTSKYLLELEQKLAQQEETIANFTKDQKASIKVFKEQKNTIENLQASNQNLIAGNERLTKANQQLTQQAKTKDKTLKDLKEETKAYQKDLAKANQANLKTQEQNKTLTSEITLVKQNHSQLVKQNASLIEKYSQLENSYQNLSQTLSNQKQALASYQEKNQLLEEKLNEAQNQDLSVYSSSSEQPALAQDYQQRIEELETEQEEIISQAETARNEQAETIEKLETENTQLDTDLNKAVDMLESKDQVIADLQAKNSELSKTISQLENQAKTKAEPNEPEAKTFTCSDCNQAKPQDQLSRVFGKFSFCLECSKKARQTAQQEKTTQKPQPQLFICHLCSKNKQEIPNLMKLDETLSEYLVCGECRPLAKEFNEADLITDELWEKYPYSSASEILELEFGIVKK